MKEKRTRLKWRGRVWEVEKRKREETMRRVEKQRSIESKLGER